MEVPSSYECFKVIRKPDEVDDKNMPSTMVDAVILFRRTNETKALEKCASCLNELLKLLAAGPDGKTQINIGHGSVCWDCGYAGIPNNIEEIEQQASPDLAVLKPLCAQCNSGNVNMLQCLQPDGSGFPWIEVVEK